MFRCRYVQSKRPPEKFCFNQLALRLLLDTMEKQKQEALALAKRRGLVKEERKSGHKEI